MAPNIKLVYFPHMGREETARLMFAYAGVAYEDHRIPYADWPTKKEEMPFCQLPVMHIDDQIICQSGAILRYAARICGLTGRNDVEEAKADMVCECLFDIMLRFPWLENDPVKKEQIMNELLTSSIPKSLKKLESIFLKESGEYFVGNQITYSDFALLNVGQYLVEQKGDIFDKTPVLKNHMEKIESIPSIAEWIAIRPKPNK